MIKRTVYLITISAIALFIMASCGSKKKDTCDLPECKTLMKKTWKYDAEASRTYALTKAGKASGIKNLKDIKLKKDVKKAVDFLSAKKLYFSWGGGKYKHRLVCSVTTGKSFLKSKRTGYWKLVDKGKTLKIDLYGKKKVEKLTYKVVELSENKLVIQKQGKSTVEIYGR